MNIKNPLVFLINSAGYIIYYEAVGTSMKWIYI